MTLLYYDPRFLEHRTGGAFLNARNGLSKLSRIWPGPDSMASARVPLGSRLGTVRWRWFIRSTMRRS